MPTRNAIIHNRQLIDIPGKQDLMDSQTIKDLIERGLPDAAVQVFSEDNTHFQAVVIAEAFSGKRPLARHQQVYATLGPLVGADIHALSIRAYTPGEWQAKQGTGGASD
jgi:acid stress-induced BolA-like protein IbaG/YrbA